jgi:hypothetical protein
MRTTIAAERELDAPAAVLYHCLADYRTHHRPEGFLPPAFSDLEVLRGGVGDGTEATWTVDAGGRRTITARITEPEPGHTLLETADGLVTTFTVDPTAAGAIVRFETVIEEPGLRGVLTRLFAPRMLAPLYADELNRLGEYARTHGPLLD